MRDEGVAAHGGMQYVIATIGYGTGWIRFGVVTLAAVREYHSCGYEKE